MQVCAVQRLASGVVPGEHSDLPPPCNGAVKWQGTDLVRLPSLHPRLPSPG